MKHAIDCARPAYRTRGGAQALEREVFLIWKAGRAWRVWWAPPPTGAGNRH